MKICLITSSFPRNEADNSGIFLYELSESLINKGVEVIVVAPHYKNTAFQETINGIKIYRFAYLFPTSLQKLAYGSGIIKNIKQRKLLLLQVPFFIFSELLVSIYVQIKERPDIIHAHWSIPQGLISITLKALFKKPYLLSIHGSDVYALHGGLVGKINDWTIRKADFVTANSKATLEVIKKIIPLSKSSFIPMGVNTSKFNNHPNKNRPNIKKVIFIGRLIECKGVEFLIRSLPLIQDSLKNTKISIIGDGPDKKHLIKLCEKLGVSKDVIFEGTVPHSKITKYLRDSDVFVLPSIITEVGETEGQGLVILEAMASGIPVVGSNIGGIPTMIIDRQTGLLVKQRDEKDIARAVIEIIDNPSLRRKIVENAQSLVKSKYSWDTISSSFIKIFTSLTREDDII